VRLPPNVLIGENLTATRERLVDVKDDESTKRSLSKRCLIVRRYAYHTRQGLVTPFYTTSIVDNRTKGAKGGSAVFAHFTLARVTTQHPRCKSGGAEITSLRQEQCQRDVPLETCLVMQG
jgi:hypothetical protein